MFGASGRTQSLLDCNQLKSREARHVDLALRLNVLAVFAAFAFVAAVLLGAF